MQGKLNGTAGKERFTTETLVIAALIALCILPFLGETLFSTKGEPREAVIAVSMLKTGNWILPVTFGAEIPYKPPMLAWFVALFGWLNHGTVTEFLSRLPSALAYIIMCVVMFRTVAHRKGLAIGVASTLLLAGCFEVYRNATICRVDMLMTMFIVTAIIALFRQGDDGDRDTWCPSLAGALLMSGAVLTKGPVGMLLPCGIVWLYRLLRGRNFWSTTVSISLSGLISLILPTAWYFAAWQQGGEDFMRLAMEENFGRFTGTMSYESHENPAWYNLLTLSYGISPYNLLLILSLPWLPKLLKTDRKHLLNRLRGLDAITLLSLVAATAVFVFYCIPKSKRSAYLLPMYPFVAYFIALYSRRLLNYAPAVLRIFCWIMVIAGIALSVSAIAVSFGAADGLPDFQAVANEMTYRPDFVVLSAVGICLLAGVALLRDLCTRKPLRNVCGYVLGYVLIVFATVTASVLPLFMNPKSDKVLADAIEAYLPKDATVYSFRPDAMHRYYTVDFYMDDRLRLFDREKPAEGWLIVGEEDGQFLKWRFGNDYTLTTVSRLPESSETGQTTLLQHFRRN